MINLTPEVFSTLQIIFMAVLGACFGSFAALIIWRMPRGYSIIVPRSFCSSCATPLKVWHNIPIFSFLFLRGRCAYCRAPIGLRNLVIELLMAMAMAALFIKFGWQPALFERFVLVFFLICLAYIDIDTFSLPLSLLTFLIGFGIVATFYYSLNPLAYRPPSEHFFSRILVYKSSAFFSATDRVVGALAGGGFFSLINLLATPVLRKAGRLEKNQWAMGWGDPMLCAGIGLYVGASHLVMVVFVAGVLGTLAGIVVTCFEPQKNVAEQENDIAQGAIPFGPFLAIAALYTYLF